MALPYLSSLRPLIVLSGSMEPAIHTGSLIFIDTKNKEGRPGDIVTLSLSMGKDPNALVTHRVVREEDGLLVTRGDANVEEDHTRLSRDRLVGTYVFQIPRAGYLIVFVRQAFLKVRSFIRQIF